MIALRVCSEGRDHRGGRDLTAGEDVRGTSRAGGRRWEVSCLRESFAHRLQEKRAGRVKDMEKEYEQQRALVAAEMERFKAAIQEKFEEKSKVRASGFSWVLLYVWRERERAHEG